MTDEERYGWIERRWDSSPGFLSYSEKSVDLFDYIRISFESDEEIIFGVGT